MSRTILVTGATGRQGGPVIKALQGSDFKILALTRDTTSIASQKLSSSFPGVQLVQGDLDNAAAIFEKSKHIINEPIWGVFSVQAKVSGPDVSIEEKQGKDLIDQALANNVQFFVYSSVDRGGDKSSYNPTPIPHWATKHNIEKYLEQKANGTTMRYGVLRPVGFMEGLTDDFMGKAFASMWKSALPNDMPIQMIATKDIGWFAAHMFNNPDLFAGQYLSIAGAQLTFDEANLIFQRKFGREMPQTFGVVAHMLLHMVKEVGTMFKWMKKEGTAADIQHLKLMHPGLTDFGTWLETESQFRSS